jgi:hypothetical protein
VKARQQALERVVCKLVAINPAAKVHDMDLDREMEVHVSPVGLSDGCRLGFAAGSGKNKFAGMDECDPRSPDPRCRRRGVAAHGTVIASPPFGVTVLARLNPVKVALGAPVGVAAPGWADVMMQSVKTTLLNAQSLPSCCCTRTLNRVPSSASFVSRPTAPPMARTVMLKVIALVAKITPIWVFSTE